MNHNSHGVPEYQSATIPLPPSEADIDAAYDHMESVPPCAQFPNTRAVVTIRFEIDPDKAMWPQAANNVLGACGGPDGITQLVHELVDWTVADCFGVEATVAHTRVWSGPQAAADLKSNRAANRQALWLAQALEDDRW